MTTTKWSDDAFLDTLRKHGDARADACVAELDPRKDFAHLFRAMTYNDDPLPPDTPEPLLRFFAETRRLPAIETDRARFPDGVDRDRIKRGERVFLDHAIGSGLVLLAKALPEGYSAPCLSEILNLSGNLERHPYRRLLGVLQLVVNVCSVGGFDHGGKAIITAQQARLLHAGIRHVVPAHLPSYESQFGLPVNAEDMLGTIMGLSYLVIDGLPGLGYQLDPADAEDYYYLWRVFAQAMGIHPPGNADTNEWVQATLAEAAEFYAAYSRRHYAPTPELNRAGAALARANQQMLEDMLPPWMRATGFSGLPRFLVSHLIGPEGCRRVGLEPYELPEPVLSLTAGAFKVWIRTWGFVDRIDPRGRLHPTLSQALIQGMITQEYGAGVTFMIPENLNQVRDMVRESGRPVA